MERLPHITHQRPKWSEVRELVQFRGLELDPVARRLRRCHTVDDLRAAARRTTPRAIFDYVDGAAEDELTNERNVRAFRRAVMHPVALTDVSQPDTSTELFNRRMPLPLIFAPTGYTRMMHHHGEASVARVAQRHGLTYSLSTVGTTSVEDVRAAAPEVDLWFQLYVTGDAHVNETLIARARAAGCTGLIVTVDTSVGGQRLRDDRNGLTIPPTLTPATFANMSLHPGWWLPKLTTAPIEFASLQGLKGAKSEEIANMLFDPTLSYETLARVRELWDGTLLVKGILTAESACRAKQAGVDGVILSNHGGRQLDRTAPPLDVLPEVRQAVGPDFPVLLDSGIRHGYDIATAIALGADAVLIGRAYLYAIMAGGEPGVERLVEILAGQYRRCLQLLGVPRTADLGPQHVSYVPELRGAVAPVDADGVMQATD